MDIIARLLKRLEEERKIKASNEVTFGLLKPELDKFNGPRDLEKPVDIYTVRLALRHRDEAANTSKFIDDLVEAITLIRELRIEVENLKAVNTAASALIADVKRRYPGEELRCEYMKALDAATQSSQS